MFIFFKVELISFQPHLPNDFDNMLKASKEFMEILGNCKLEERSTSEGIDLYLNGIEVGSYGIRKHNSYQWVYGTGLALPRFDKALNKI